MGFNSAFKELTLTVTVGVLTWCSWIRAS